MKPMVIWCGLLACLTAGSGIAADTSNVLAGGVCINEVLIDPNSATNNFDTDGDGTASDLDEFVELYNLSGSAVDISGWQLWDSGNGQWFTFPAATSLGAGNFAVVVVAVQGGALPAVSGGDLAFDAARGGSVINNGGDNIVLFNPTADQYIQLVFNGDPADDPTTTYAGFSATATRIGTAEAFGSDTDGISLTRTPPGDTNVVLHTIAMPGVNASPAAPLPVELMTFDVK